MKRSILQTKLGNLAVMAASVFALAACGGGGGGGDHGGGGGLATAFTKKAEAAGTAGLAGALFSTAAEIRYQFLLMAADVKGSGGIKSVGFRYGADLASAISCPNTTIRMGATTVGTLAITYDSNVNQGAGSSATVLSNGTVSIPAGTTGNYFNIDLATPFEYNGVDNLVVEVTRTSACSGQISVQLPNVAYNGLVFLAAAGASTAVDGTPFLGAAHMQLAFTAGNNRQDYGGATSNAFPFFAVGGQKRQQTLYLASDIQGSGPVTGIALQANGTTVAGTYAYTLMLGHSTLAALGTTFASNFSGAPVTVANAVTNFTVPAGIPAGEWIWVPIPDGVFTYNGVDNLIVDITTNSASANNAQRVTLIPNRRLWANPNAATGTVNDATHHIALRFGGHMAKVSAGGANNNAIFNGSFSTATLYSATALGTSGSITSVSCRLLSPSTAASYANFRVVMGHSTGSTLTTPAADFVSQNTVFNGTFSIPAGLSTGDWLEIPLSTPFAYDGKSNLIVWMGNAGPGPGTMTVHNCRGEDNATRYTGGLGGSTTGVGSAAYDFGVFNWTTDIRMTVQK